jgi:hypothetical protein
MWICQSRVLRIREFIADLQILAYKNALNQLNNAYGLISKATDWAPEIGVVFPLQVR